MKKQQIQTSSSDAVPSGKKQPKEALHRHPFVIPVITFLVLIVVSAVGFVLMGSETIGPDDKRVVKLYVDGQSQTVPTRAKTVQELLNRLEITTTKEDIIEPTLDTPIDSDNFAVNIYRARSVTVVDDETNREVSVISAHQDPRDVAKQAGVKLFPEDLADVTPPSDVFEDGIDERIIIDRALPVQLNLYGKSYKVRTHSNTVQELMEERSVAFDAQSVLPSLDTKLRANEVVYVTNPDKKITRVEQVIKPGEQKRQDPNVPIGEERVSEEGQEGRKVVIYEIDKNGKKKVLQEVIVVRPIDRVVVMGTKVPTVAISGNKADVLAAAGVPASQHFAADFIISKESGWRLNAQNAGGCLGLGQACPGSKLIAACPAWQTDVVCQVQYFSGYVNGRYGGWSGAYQTWQIQGWY
jgi:uncharacterized protein YabE (DUF348 family)